jgi:DNA-binding LacI/PurR family transcriptional regulator
MNRLVDPKPTIKDVARVCGVSVATVSYVINGTRVLKPDTRARVLEAMKEMNYHPNAVARGLSSKRVHTLGVHCGVTQADEFITNPYAAGIVGGILKRASLEGFDVTLFTNRWQSVQKSAPALRDGRTDGMIAIAPPLGCDMLQGLSSLGMPLVAISAPARPGIPVVDVDNYAGAKMAARHLIELGHRRIAAIWGDNDLFCFAPRRQGFCDALSEAGLPLDPQWLVTSHFDGSLAFEQASVLLHQPVRPTAICAGNDTIALAVIDAARGAGLCVPQQLSVVGFDDSPFATVVTPSLTTIRQPLRDIGECAAALLINRMNGHAAADDEKGHWLCPELVARGSTGPAPSKPSVLKTS